MSTAEVRSLYRKFWRQAHRSVMWVSPQRFVIASKLSSAFRSPTPQDLDPVRQANTLAFLKSAAETLGVEHRVVKTLCFVHWSRYYDLKTAMKPYPKQAKNFKEWLFEYEAYDNYEKCLQMMNDSLKLCLR
ncbi:hypothetical protein SAICODRAFT_6770 [Saitoella complicata NRRL Y-17804]|uniref:uncharacterized protein n=1 Tax=Saitoella complicata (strain BCRC 22490 / CBS 7301 / JCM 7358 / NBRC 10748 / NRRL Y-17804) TaxID=698492 RepID=UPI0008676269|nr:uncharacterized protein SAICODRAFT_6770 [Saitoella complicata NRRL Y-17804]ODQ53988.1 hypothetical protein SAICODRAFT_6770 [Saitoella complicata NRRL Y-17804]